MAVVKEYMRLSSEYQSKYGNETILLMQVGSFMEMYGPGTPINEVAKICGLNVVAKSGDSDTLMAGFKENFIDKYVIKIQEAGYTSVIYKQHPEDVTQRQLDCIVSPGTYFSTEGSSQDVITNNLCCIWISVCNSRFLGKHKKMCYIGVSNIDIYTGNTNVFQYEIEYVKNSPNVFDQLERFVSIYHPLETIIISDFIESELNSVIQYIGLSCKKIHTISESTSLLAANSQQQVYQRELFSRFYGVENTDSLLPTMYDNNMASQTLCYLLDFIYQHNASLLNKIKLPTFDNTCSNRLVLANHSLKQLNIIDDNYRGKYSSVLKTVNLCITPMGKRKFEHTLLHPIIDSEELTEIYELTEHFCNKYNSEKMSEFKTILSSITDISKNIRQLHMFKISPAQLVTLYKSILSADLLLKLVKKDMRVIGSKDNVENYKREITNFVTIITSAIQIDKSETLNDFKDFDINFIVSGYDSELDECVLRLSVLEQEITMVRLYLNELLAASEKKPSKKLSTTQTLPDYVKFEENDKSPPTLICTSRRFELLKSALPKKHIKHEFSSTFNMMVSKELIFSSKNNSSNVNIHFDELDVLCSEYYKTKNKLNQNINRVYIEFIAKLEPLCGNLELLETFITDIDMLYCKSLIVKRYNYCKPIIDETHHKSFIIAEGLRHPIIEQLQEDEQYVSNDITLGIDNQDGILLYGVNMAGKTSFIRSLGIAIVMAQSGLFVPASTFLYKPYHYLFTRIIGNDNLFKGLSTFAVEMTELKTILQMSNENSMVIGDEVCAGTETISASSIFVSAILHLSEKCSSYIFATHLHEIVDFDEIQSNSTLSLKHMDVTYDAITDKLVYNRKIMEGSGSKTYGLEVCKSLHMLPSFLETANTLRLKYYSKIENESILSLQKSVYNKNKLVGLCEKCKMTQGTETHHIIPQHTSDEYNYVLDDSGNRYHKNSKKNLMSVCEKCHKKIHYKM
jgi:DNA mismatch repair protein MutS